MVDSQQGNSRDDAPNGELGVDAQQLGQIQAAGAGDQQGDAGSDGDQHSEQQEEAAEGDQAAGRAKLARNPLELLPMDPSVQTSVRE